MHLPEPTFQIVGWFDGSDPSNLSDLSNLSVLTELEVLDALVLPAHSSDQGPWIDSTASSEYALTLSKISYIEILEQWPDFKGKAGELIEIPVTSVGQCTRIFILGFGDGSIEEARKAGAVLGRKVKATGFSVYSAYAGNYDAAVAHLLAISLSQYGWNLKSAHSTSDLTARAKGGTSFFFNSSQEDAVRRASIIAEATWRTRDLIHTPSNIKSPEWLAEQAKSLVQKSKSSDLKVTVKKGSGLAKFGGLLAVGNSSPNAAPHLIEIRYAPPQSESWPHVVLVGKGITYDTGGISLKRPYDLMVPMKTDMAGAAAILAATVAMAKIKPGVRVTALMMCAENMVSATAQRPSDVITHYGGTTVEVINTDAEGRLVLADGLAYADLELEPDYLLDIATLTGAATLGLGKQFAAMYSRNATLTAQLHEIGERIGDRVWPMPLLDDYLPALSSNIADFNHDASAQNFSAGSVTAALFLEQFVGKQNWIHLDIAGPARSDVDSGEVIKGGTGFGTRLLIEWLASIS